MCFDIPLKRVRKNYLVFAVDLLVAHEGSLDKGIMNRGQKGTLRKKEKKREKKFVHSGNFIQVN